MKQIKEFIIEKLIINKNINAHKNDSLNDIVKYIKHYFTISEEVENDITNEIDKWVKNNVNNIDDLNGPFVLFYATNRSIKDFPKEDQDKYVIYDWSDFSKEILKYRFNKKIEIKKTGILKTCNKCIYYKSLYTGISFWFTID